MVVGSGRIWPRHWRLHGHGHVPKVIDSLRWDGPHVWLHWKRTIPSTRYKCLALRIELLPVEAAGQWVLVSIWLDCVKVCGRVVSISISRGNRTLDRRGYRPAVGTSLGVWGLVHWIRLLGRAHLCPWLVHWHVWLLVRFRIRSDLGA